MQFRWLCLCLAALLWLPGLAADAQKLAGGDTGGPTMSIRLIAAANSGKTENAAALGDILPLLEDNLRRYASYALVCQRQAVIMEGTRIKLDRGLSVTVSGIKDKTCTVAVDRRGKTLVSTRLRLEPGRPVILGGFPEDDGTTLILVITL